MDEESIEIDEQELEDQFNDYLHNLTSEEHKKILDYLHKFPEKAPTQATKQEVSAILNWLNNARKDEENLSHFQYKDCAFNKCKNLVSLEGNEAEWELTERNNVYMWTEFMDKEGL